MRSLELGPRHTEETLKNFSNDTAGLQKKFKKKSFLEKHVAEFRTKESAIRGAENPEIKRGRIFRFERGQILKAYQILREQIREAEKRGEDATEKRGLLKEIREKAKILERNLDELNRQYYENVKKVEINTEFGKFSVPVAELDLNKGKRESEKDERIPYFLLGSVATNYHQSAALSMSLALDGRKVLIPAWPEQAMVGRPDNFAEILKNQQDLKLHKEFAKQTIKNLGLDKVNVMGYSMGGAIALELAQDQDMEEMQDLIIVEPPCLEEKGFAGLAKDFAVKEGLLKTLPSAEGRTKMFLQGEDTKNISFLIDDGRILSKKYFNPENLSKIMPKGRYEFWAGTKSAITDYKVAEKTFLEADDLRLKNNPDASPVEIHIIEGGSHDWPVSHGLGFSRLLKEERPEKQVTSLNLSDLENSGMERILKEVK